MTAEDATKMLAVLKAAYPNHYRGMTKDDAIGTINVWATQFSSMSAFVVFIAVNKHISTVKFPPTPCEIKDIIKRLYYESAETLTLHRQGVLQLDETKIKTLNAIREETQQYRGDKAIEPSLNELLGMYNNKTFLPDNSFKAIENTP